MSPVDTGSGEDSETTARVRRLRDAAHSLRHINRDREHHGGGVGGDDEFAPMEWLEDSDSATTPSALVGDLPHDVHHHHHHLHHHAQQGQGRPAVPPRHKQKEARSAAKARRLAGRQRGHGQHRRRGSPALLRSGSPVETLEDNRDHITVMVPERRASADSLTGSSPQRAHEEVLAQVHAL